MHHQCLTAHVPALANSTARAEIKESPQSYSFLLLPTHLLLSPSTTHTKLAQLALVVNVLDAAHSGLCSLVQGVQAHALVVHLIAHALHMVKNVIEFDASVRARNHISIHIHGTVLLCVLVVLMRL